MSSGVTTGRGYCTHLLLGLLGAGLGLHHPLLQLRQLREDKIKLARWHVGGKENSIMITVIITQFPAMSTVESHAQEMDNTPQRGGRMTYNNEIVHTGNHTSFSRTIYTVIMLTLLQFTLTPTHHALTCYKKMRNNERT